MLLSALHQLGGLADEVGKASSTNSSLQSALERAIAAAERTSAQLDHFRAVLPAVLSPLDSLADISAQSIDIETPQGQIALCRFQLGLRFHVVKLMANLPLMSYLAHRDILQEASPGMGPAGLRLARANTCAKVCVDSALRIVSQGVFVRSNLTKGLIRALRIGQHL